MKLFSITTGKTRIEFSVWEVNGRYQARINDMVMFESHDYESIRESIYDNLAINTPYVGLTH